MSLRVGISVAHDLPKLVGQAGERIRRGAMRGAERFRARAKLDFRRDTRGALGDRAANTWRDDLYPKGRAQSWHPAVVISSKWPVPIEAHAYGATIVAKKAVMLAIPTEEVPVRKQRAMTPAEVEAYYDQELIMRPSKRKPGVLLAFVDKGLRGRLMRWRKKGAPRDRAPEARRAKLTLMFVLVRQVTLRQRININEIAEKLEPEWARYVADEIRRELEQG